MTREKIRSEILATPEAAAAIGVTPFTLGRWTRRGIVKPIIDARVGLLYWKGDLQRFTENPDLVASLVKGGRPRKRKALAK